VELEKLVTWTGLLCFDHILNYFSIELLTH
jgi:hypothetical protein